MGWARQAGERTVEAVLAEALSTVLRRDVALAVAGRTDRGVHARGQVASHEGEPAARRALNGLLPADISVLASEPMGQLRPDGVLALLPVDDHDPPAGCERPAQAPKVLYAVVDVVVGVHEEDPIDAPRREPRVGGRPQHGNDVGGPLSLRPGP